MKIFLGEIYPESGIRLVNYGDFSKELCCGTHAFNTKELMDFSFINVKSPGRSNYVFTAVTGEDAIEAQKSGEEFLNYLKNIKENFEAKEFSEILPEIRNTSKKYNKISHLKKLECEKIISEIKEEIKNKGRDVLRYLLANEMKDVEEKNQQNSHVVHFLNCSDLMSVSLEKATKFIKDKPVIVLSLNEGELKARCVVPKKDVKENFDAQKWLSVVGKHVKSEVENPRGQDPLNVCFMKGRRIKPEDSVKVIEEAVKKANKFAARLVR